MSSRNEEIRLSRSFSAEQKRFHLDYKENERGAFVRITEESKGKRNCVIVPLSGVNDLQDALDDLMDEVDAGGGN